MWKEHIEQWSDKNNKSSTIVEGILLRSGWNPDKYQSSMKKELFFYLDEWYKLHVKKLPPIATQFRRNPEPDWCPNCSCFNCQQISDYPW